MATLRDDNLSFDFRFAELDECLWVQYEFYFRWKNEPVFRDELLKRSPAGWADRPPGALLANEFDGDSFLPKLKKAIMGTEPVCWQPTEPDVTIAFFPGMQFPFIPGWRNPAGWDEGTPAAREGRQRRKAARKGLLPDDRFTMIVFVDSYNWPGSSYSNTGFALHMTPTRKELATFYYALKNEYDEFVVRENLEERIRERNQSLMDELEDEEAGNEPASPRQDESPVETPPDAPSSASPSANRYNQAFLDEELRTRYALDEIEGTIADVLARAAVQDQPASIIYLGGEHPGRTRSIKPRYFFTVPDLDHFYLAAVDIDAGAERCYRLDRIESATLA